MAVFVLIVLTQFSRAFSFATRFISRIIYSFFVFTMVTKTEFSLAFNMGTLIVAVLVPTLSKLNKSTVSSCCVEGLFSTLSFDRLLY